MDHHPIPRQITTFEFKLIGFMTIKQFAYVAFSLIFAFIFYIVVPVVYLNIVVAILTALVGVAFAFAKINERSLDVWIRNFARKLFSPSQFHYHKKNHAPAFLLDALSHKSPQNIAKTHVDAKQKLAVYLGKQKDSKDKKRASLVRKALEKPVINTSVKKNGQQKEESLSEDTKLERPFLYGVVKNRKDLPLPGVLLYIKDDSGNAARILKTNHNGVFATYHPLSPGHYSFETKDLSQRHFFDTMAIDVDGAGSNPITIFSKELI